MTTAELAALLERAAAELRAARQQTPENYPDDDKLIGVTEASIVLGISRGAASAIKGLWFVPEGMSDKRTTRRIIRNWQRAQTENN